MDKSKLKFEIMRTSGNEAGFMPLDSIENILLSKNNPRFTVLESFDNDLIKIIKDGTSDNSEKETFNELFYLEGDLSDFCKLLESINDFGFLNESEPLILVYNKEINKFITAEGNRRVMVLKMIFQDEYNLPTIEQIIENIKGYDNTNSNEGEDKDFDFNEKKQKKLEDRIRDNYDKIIELIKQIKSKDENWYVYYTVVDNSNLLWSQIYDKHLTGERPGMRKWSRSKYFADLLSVFPDGIVSNLDDNKQIFKNINRDKTNLIRDFKNAQFVYSCFYFSEEFCSLDDEEKQNINFKKWEILNALVMASKISALEPNHSYNKVRDILINEIIHTDSNDFAENYFNIKYKEENNRIQFIENKISKEKLLTLIYTNWKSGKITTRPFKEEAKNSIIGELKLLLNNVNINKKMSLDEIDRLDDFSLSISELNRIYKNQKVYYPKSDLKRLENVISIKGTSEQIVKEIRENEVLRKIEDDDPLNVFNILISQLKHNSKPNNTYLNAIFCSVRSFFEQFFIWGAYFSIDENNVVEQQVHINEMSMSEINSLFNRHRSNLLDNKKPIADYLKILKDDIDEADMIFISQSLDDILKKPEWRDIINENIHASHRIYVSSKFDQKIVDFKKYLELMEKIINNMDFKKLIVLNDDIKKRIENSKKNNINNIT